MEIKAQLGTYFIARLPEFDLKTSNNRFILLYIFDLIVTGLERKETVFDQLHSFVGRIERYWNVIDDGEDFCTRDNEIVMAEIDRHCLFSSKRRTLTEDYSRRIATELVHVSATSNMELDGSIGGSVHRVARRLPPLSSTISAGNLCNRSLA